MNLKAVIVEFIGTFALCLVGAGSMMINKFLGADGPGLVGIALAHGLILAVVVTATMNVSGGHINPAVTISMLVCGRIGIVNAVGYIVAQLAGGLLAGLLLMNVIFVNLESDHGDVVGITMNGTPKFEPKNLARSDTLPGWGRAGAPANPPLPRDPVDDSTDASASRPAQDEPDPAPSAETAPVRPAQQLPQRNLFVERLRQAEREAAVKACVIEGIITFLLVFAFFGTVVDPRRPNVGGFGVGFAVAANILLAEPLTGAAMNPARVFGTGIVTQDEVFYAQQWVYWVGPVAGAIAAALIYNFAILPQEQKA